MNKGIACVIICAVAVVGATTRGTEAFPPEETKAAAWKSLGPTGGGVQGMVVNPANSKEVFVSSSAAQGQVYRSIDGGSSWTRQSLFKEAIGHLGFSSSNPNVIYTFRRLNLPLYLYRSVNKGVTWTSHLVGDVYGIRIFVSPSNSNLIFIGTYGQSGEIFRSINGGATWTKTTFPDTTSIDYITSNSVQPRILYAAGGGNSYFLYKSADSGGTWHKIAGPTKPITGLVVHPATANRLWYATYYNVFRSSDGGTTWEQNNGSISPYALAIDRDDPQVIYAGGLRVNQCYRSADGGINWVESEIPPGGLVNDLIARGATILCGTTAGIDKSADAGASFTASQTGYKAATITAIASAPSAPSTIYAESAGAALLKSTNAGSTWESLPYFYRCESVRKIIVEPSDPSEILALAGG